MFTLKIRDFLKGLVVAVLAAIVSVVSTSIQTGTFNINWKQLGIVAGSAALAYITKNFFTDDVKAATKVIEATPDKTVVDTNTGGVVK